MNRFYKILFSAHKVKSMHLSYLNYMLQVIRKVVLVNKYEWKGINTASMLNSFLYSLHSLYSFIARTNPVFAKLIDYSYYTVRSEKLFFLYVINIHHIETCFLQQLQTVMRRKGVQQTFVMTLRFWANRGNEVLFASCE
jgi:hypothetical protein